MSFLIFAVCLCASGIGAIVGAGGGVIIKPVMDALGIFTASEISFLSGCTVFAMSLSSLIRGRKSEVKLDASVSVPIAIGSVLGGLVGKQVFDCIKLMFGSETFLGGIQSIAMTAVLLIVLSYLLLKQHLPSLNVKSKFAALLIGLVLGMSSSFLGIGGGTLNVAMILFFFSMDTKQAAKNSIFVILFSQAANIIFSAVSGNIPDVRFLHLAVMVAGGVSGGILGSCISKKINSRKVEYMLIALVIVVTAITVRNAVIAFS